MSKVLQKQKVLRIGLKETLKIVGSDMESKKD